MELDRHLDSLSPEMFPLACQLIARCAEAGIPVMILNTRRTAEQQAELVKQGVSWTDYSRHQDGDAIDIVPYDVFLLHGADKLRWSPDDPVWPQIGAIGQRIGLKWGVMLKEGRRIDLGHFERIRKLAGAVAT